MTTANLATVGTRALATVPDYVKEGIQGKELITAKDIRFPALKLAQSMTPQAKRSDPKYIDGLLEGFLFNTVTQEVYGDKPMSLVVVAYRGRRNTEFDPNDRTVVLETNIPDDDPRCNFTVGQDGVKKKPSATTFKDFVVVALRDGLDPETLTLSVKGTQLKKVTDLLTMFSTSKFPTYAYLVELTVAPETWKKGAGFGVNFKVKGWAPAEVYAKAAKIYEAAKDAKVVIEDEGDDEPATATGSDDDIPF